MITHDEQAILECYHELLSGGVERPTVGEVFRCWREWGCRYSWCEAEGEIRFVLGDRVRVDKPRRYVPPRNRGPTHRGKAVELLAERPRATREIAELLYSSASRAHISNARNVLRRLRRQGVVTELDDGRFAVVPEAAE